MFGGLAFLINGNMAVSASSQGGLLLRVDPAQTDSCSSEPHARVRDARPGDGRLAARRPRGNRTDDDLALGGPRRRYARSLPPK